MSAAPRHGGQKNLYGLIQTSVGYPGTTTQPAYRARLKRYRRQSTAVITKIKKRAGPDKEDKEDNAVNKRKVNIVQFTIVIDLVPDPEAAPYGPQDLEPGFTMVTSEL